MLERAETVKLKFNADLHPNEWTPNASPVPNFDICVIIQIDEKFTKNFTW